MPLDETDSGCRPRNWCFSCEGLWSFACWSSSARWVSSARFHRRFRAATRSPRFRAGKATAGNVASVARSRGEPNPGEVSQFIKCFVLRHAELEVEANHIRELLLTTI